MRVATIIVLFHRKYRMKGEEKEYLFFSTFNAYNISDFVDRIFGCVCLRWSADYEVDHTIQKSPPMSRKMGVAVG